MLAVAVFGCKVLRNSICYCFVSDICVDYEKLNVKKWRRLDSNQQLSNYQFDYLNLKSIVFVSNICYLTLFLLIYSAI